MRNLTIIFGLYLICLNTSGQEKNVNLIGLKIGIVEQIYYDEALNFKVYKNLSFNPYHLKYSNHGNKHLIICRFYYQNLNLTQKVIDSDYQNDYINLQTGLIEFIYHRLIFREQKLNLYFGAGFNSSGFGGERYFNKKYPVIQYNTVKQQTYEIKYFTLIPSAGVNSKLSDKFEINFHCSLPIVSLMSKNHNPKISPFAQDLMIVGINKYSGWQSELALTRRVKKVIFEFYHQFKFEKYRYSNVKKNLFNQTGIGVYYVF